MNEAHACRNKSMVANIKHLCSHRLASLQHNHVYSFGKYNINLLYLYISQNPYIHDLREFAVKYSQPLTLGRCLCVHASRTMHTVWGSGKETLGMDKIWMPVLEQSCMELIERQRVGEEGRAQTAGQYSRWERTRDIESDQISVRGGGTRTTWPARIQSKIFPTFWLWDGVCVYMCHVVRHTVWGRGRPWR